MPVDLQSGYHVSVAFTLPISWLHIVCDLHERQSASACVQRKKSVEQIEKTRRQLVEQANRKAMDAEAAAERYVQTTCFLILSLLILLLWFTFVLDRDQAKSAFSKFDMLVPCKLACCISTPSCDC